MTRYLCVLITLIVLLAGCSKHDDPVAPPTTGTVTGRVADAASSAALGSVRVTVADAQTNSPLATFTTGGDGTFHIELSPGSFYLRFARQGYEPIPPMDILPVPVAVTAGASAPEVLVEETIDYLRERFFAPGPSN